MSKYGTGHCVDCGRAFVRNSPSHSHCGCAKGRPSDLLTVKCSCGCGLEFERKRYLVEQHENVWVNERHAMYYHRNGKPYPYTDAGSEDLITVKCSCGCGQELKRKRYLVEQHENAWVNQKHAMYYQRTGKSYLYARRTTGRKKGELIDPVTVKCACGCGKELQREQWFYEHYGKAWYSREHRLYFNRHKKPCTGLDKDGEGNGAEKVEVECFCGCGTKVLRNAGIIEAGRKVWASQDHLWYYRKTGRPYGVGSLQEIVERKCSCGCGAAVSGKRWIADRYGLWFNLNHKRYYEKHGSPYRRRKSRRKNNLSKEVTVKCSCGCGLEFERKLWQVNAYAAHYFSKAHANYFERNGAPYPVDAPPNEVVEVDCSCGCGLRVSRTRAQLKTTDGIAYHNEEHEKRAAGKRKQRNKSNARLGKMLSDTLGIDDPGQMSVEDVLERLKDKGDLAC